jgi:hypothetical protein
MTKLTNGRLEKPRQKAGFQVEQAALRLSAPPRTLKSEMDPIGKGAVSVTSFSPLAAGRPVSACPRGHGACAGWQLPLLNGVTLLPLSPKSPEFNPVNDIGQFMRDNWLSNRVFKSYDDILDHCCFAWNSSSIALENHVHRDQRLGLPVMIIKTWYKGRLTSLVRLSYLAPGIVRALLAGRQPIELTPTRLMRLSKHFAPDHRPNTNSGSPTPVP